MTVKNPKELFVMLLSDARQSTERSTNFYQEISQAAQDPDIKEALESRAWISEKDLSSIDRCFELIGEKPVKLSGRLQEVFVEDFRRELAEILGSVVNFAVFVRNGGKSGICLQNICSSRSIFTNVASALQGF